MTRARHFTFRQSESQFDLRPSTQPKAGTRTHITARKTQVPDLAAEEKLGIEDADLDGPIAGKPRIPPPLRPRGLRFRCCLGGGTQFVHTSPTRGFRHLRLATTRVLFCFYRPAFQRPQTLQTLVLASYNRDMFRDLGPLLGYMRRYRWGSLWGALSVIFTYDTDGRLINDANARINIGMKRFCVVGKEIYNKKFFPD